MRWGDVGRGMPEPIKTFATRWVRRFAWTPKRDPWRGGWVWFDYYTMPQHYFHGWCDDPERRYMHHGPIMRDDRYGVIDCMADPQGYQDALAAERLVNEIARSLP